MIPDYDAWPAPELDVSAWIGTPAPLSSLRGRVVLVETFQMLCPGCVTHGIPQAKRVHATMRDVSVVGLHTVFEHHDVMGPAALRVFMSEFGIRFPVGIDRLEPGNTIPRTMLRYSLQGTPSTLLIDKAGRLRLTAFGALDDLVLGSHLGALIAEPDPPAAPEPVADPPDPAATP